MRRPATAIRAGARLAASMPRNTPEQVVEPFSALLAQSDFDGLVELDEPGAVFAPQPGQAVGGGEAIREALAGFLELRREMDGVIEGVLVSEDAALVSNRWSLRGTGPDGEPVEMGGTSSDVIRRGPHGACRIVIDNPWGLTSHATRDNLGYLLAKWSQRWNELLYRASCARASLRCARRMARS